MEEQAVMDELTFEQGPAEYHHHYLVHSHPRLSSPEGTLPRPVYCT